MTRLPRVVTCLLVLGSPMAPALSGPDDDTVDRILGDATGASTASRRFELVARIGRLEQAQLEDLVRRALRGGVNERLLGAMTLGRLSPEVNSDLWKIALSDSALEVRRIAWLHALIRPGLVTREQRRKLLDDRDPFLRAGASAGTTDPADLIPLLDDGSILVRTVIARRLGTLGGEAKSPDLATRAGLDALLIDASELVRANAIHGARCARYFPAPTLRGLVLDDRPVVHLAELLLDEPESRDSRARYGLQRELDLHTPLLAALLSTGIEPPATHLSLGIQEIGPRLSVGTIAAAALVESKDAEAIPSVRLLMRAGIKPDIQVQLTRVLEQADQEGQQGPVGPVQPPK